MGRRARQLPFYLSPPHTCSYLADRLSSTLFADPDAPMTMAAYSELLRRGFRRSGRFVYAPHCDGCRQCVSVRVPVREFRPKRIHRRLLRANADLELRRARARFDADHFALYRRYTRTRHGDSDMAEASSAEYLGFLRADWCATEFLEFFLDDRLVAVAVTDRPEGGLSAVYTFFDPELRQRSLGTYAILAQIDLARTLNLEFLYLGYWIRDCRKMAYKAGFRPIELWRDGAWQRFGATDTLPAGSVSD